MGTTRLEISALLVGLCSDKKRYHWGGQGVGKVVVPPIDDCKYAVQVHVFRSEVAARALLMWGQSISKQSALGSLRPKIRDHDTANATIVLHTETDNFL